MKARVRRVGARKDGLTGVNREGKYQYENSSRVAKVISMIVRPGEEGEVISRRIIGKIKTLGKKGQAYWQESKTDQQVCYNRVSKETGFGRGKQDWIGRKEGLT